MSEQEFLKKAMIAMCAARFSSEDSIRPEEWAADASEVAFALLRQAKKDGVFEWE